MSRLKSFHYKVVDAWGNMGTDSILEISPTDIKILWMFANGDRKETILTGSEDKFIEGLLECNILSWNNKSFENGTEDCESWYLDVAFDNKYIRCNGIGGYPKEYLDFLKHIGLDEGMSEQMKGYYRSDIKHTIVKTPSEDVFGWGSYCDVSIEELAMFETDRLMKMELRERKNESSDKV